MAATAEMVRMGTLVVAADHAAVAAVKDCLAVTMVVESTAAGAVVE